MEENPSQSDNVIEEPPKDKRIIIRLSSHLAQRYEVCPLYFDFTTNKNYALEEEVKYFGMGKFVHKALARFYTCLKEEMEFMEAFNDTVKYTESKLTSEFDLNFEETQFLLKNIKDYMSYYMNDKYIKKVLEVEKTFSKLIYEDSTIAILFEGTPDLIYENYESQTEVMDHKTESARRKLFGLNNQFLAYPFLLDNNRIYRNAIGLQKTKPPADRFYREMYSFPQGKIEHWKNNMVDIGKDIIESYRTNKWQARHSQCETNPIHRSGCMFQEVCRMAPANWEYELETEFVKTSGLYY